MEAFVMALHLLTLAAGFGSFLVVVQMSNPGAALRFAKLMPIRTFGLCDNL
jgi:hypothetical protein